ncbi:MAG TPA: SMC-Scp complex subunit ScpB [Saprospiraceae bacterium]|nr:SMC-Scp complex subunit ScpB [Saprospiraceae bacterium]
MDQLLQHIEALLFVSDNPINREEIQQALEATFETEFAGAEIDAALQQLSERYKDEKYSFEIVEIAGGLRFLTKAAFHSVIATHLRLTTKKKLSQAALETLAIIAYKQPVTKGDLESIRGVSCDYSIQKLLEKELVSIIGRSEGPGKPLLYGTSEKFMDYFGIKSLEELPKPKDFKDPESSIGEQAPVEEAG